MRETFVCKAPWTSIAFQPTGVAPCCIYKLDDVEQFVPGGKLFENIQQQFLSGQIPNGCRDCKTEVELGNNAYYEQFDCYQTDFKNLNIQEINLRSNNFCNLACRSCGPHFSSKWEEEFADNRIVISKDTNVFDKLTMLDIKNLKMIVFAGGEPTIVPEHTLLLHQLIDIGHTDVSIRVSTNLQTISYKNNNLVDLWKQFPNLYLNVSVDAVEDRAESIRSGTNWAKQYKNIQQLKDNNINFNFSITVSALNIWFLEETLDYLNAEFNGTTWLFNILLNPDILNLWTIPDEYRSDLRDMLDRCLQKNYPVNKIKKHLDDNNTSYLWDHFLFYNLILDANRGESFCKNLPMFRDLVSKYVKLQSKEKT